MGKAVITDTAVARLVAVSTVWAKFGAPAAVDAAKLLSVCQVSLADPTSHHAEKQQQQHSALTAVHSVQQH